MSCRHLLMEWYIRHSVLAIPVGAVLRHKDFQCYKCAHCGDAHRHFAELTSLMSACIYKQHSHRTLCAYFTEHVTLTHDCHGLTGWILQLCLHYRPIQKIRCAFPFAERTFILKLLMPVLNGLPSWCFNSKMGRTFNIYFTVYSHTQTQISTQLGYQFRHDTNHHQASSYIRILVPYIHDLNPNFSSIFY